MFAYLVKQEKDELHETRVFVLVWVGCSRSCNSCAVLCMCNDRGRILGGRTDVVPHVSRSYEYSFVSG